VRYLHFQKKKEGSKMTSKVREHSVVAHKHYHQVEEQLLALFDGGVAPSPDVQNGSVSCEADTLKNALSMPPLYDAYATLFWPLFPLVPEAAVQEINLATRLYVKHFLLLDDIIDADIEAQLHPLFYLKSTFFLQHSLSILYRYFPQGSPFWEEFEHHQHEFVHTFLLEKRLQEGQGELPYDAATFQRIAAGHFAMAKCAIAALATLAESPGMLQTLYDLLDEAAIAFQLHDDYFDWKTDLEHHHTTYLLLQFCAEMEVESEQQLQQLDEKVLRRRFLTSQTLQQVIDEMLAHLEYLLQAPELAPCEDWLHHLQKLRDDIANIKSHLSSIILRRRQIRLLPKNLSFIQKALWFLSTSQDAQGAWHSFDSPLGQSTSWITGYIASALQQYPTTHQMLDRAAQWLRADQLLDGGWSWNRHMPMDADSTATCLWFMTSRLSLAEVQRATAALCLFQQADGGFSSYLQAQLAPRTDADGKSTDSFGLCMSHMCVTDAAVIALCLAFESYPQLKVTYGPALASAVEYLLEQQQGDGHWHTYWWHGNIYGTALSIRALQMAAVYSKKQQQIQEAQQRGRTFLLQTQLPNGGWSAYPSNACCPFQTALALQTFTQCPEARYQSAVKAACSYLEQSQEINGCWRASTPLMRLPWSNDTHPWDWPEQAQLGHQFGTATPDHSYVFATAMVLRALPWFYEFVHERADAMFAVALKKMPKQL
jgi:hypothetical protein